MRHVQHVPDLYTKGWIGGPDERDTRHEFTHLYHAALRISRRPLPQLYFIKSPGPHDQEIAFAYRRNGR
jgi:hypothetical protein